MINLKKTSFFLIFLFVSVGLSYSQTKKAPKIYTNSKGQIVKVYKPSSFEITRPIRELAKENKVNIKRTKAREIENHFKKREVKNKNAMPYGEDPLWQKQNASRSMDSPIVNFEGLGWTDGIPLDPSGAASDKYYVQAINCKYKIYNKTGDSVTTVANLSSLWTGSRDNGDPIVLYDKHADRWFVSQFQSDDDVPFKLLVAISKTNDPTGSYYAYSFDFDNLPDYPKYSIWWDGYYFGINDEDDGTCGVLDRAKMLNGDASATMQILTASGVVANTTGFFSVLPTDADGSLPPNGSPCYFFDLQDDAWGTGEDGEEDGIKVYKMITDWDTPSNTTIDFDGLIKTAAFNSDFTEGESSNEYPQIAQKGTDDSLDAVAGIFYYRAQHRVWTD